MTTDPGRLRAEPRLDAALAVELTMRERDALMTRADWEWMLDKYFAGELRPGLEHGWVTK